jgi:hypothetical protein
MMKKVIIFSMLLMGTVSLTFAQTATPVAANVSVNEQTHVLNMQIRKLLSQINKDVSSGKLTTSQAPTAVEQVKSIRNQELLFFKQNGNRILTSAQFTQLTQSLTSLAPSF